MAHTDTGASHPAAIGRYQIVGVLGRGGMGEVFLARDPVLEREVAVKLIHGDLESTTSRERLVREARAAGRLRHPNIVTIFDAGEHDGRPFIAMEFVRGETLGNLIRRRTPMPLVKRLEMIEGACAGLAHAHRSGVVHLDVKPDNLMLDENGIVKVLDFGIARVLQSGLLVTRQLGGTLRYMSPEQIENRPLDHRSDVFSLGCALFEMITFVPAFVGSTKDIVSQISSGPVPAPGDALPALEPQLDAIVLKAMAIEPGKRYTTLDELGAELAAVRKRMDPEYDPRVETGGGGLDDIPTMLASRNAQISSILRRSNRITRRSAIAAVSLIAVLLAMSLFWMLRRNGAPPATPSDETPASVAAPTPAAPTEELSSKPAVVVPAPANDRNDVERRANVGRRGAAPELGARPTTPSAVPPGATEPSPPPVAAAPTIREDTAPPSPRPPQPAEGAPATATVPDAPITAAPAPTAESPQQRARADEEAVRETLRRYETAYRALDVNRIVQVYPSLARDQADQLKRTFATVTQYDVDVRNPQIEVQGDAAVVRATLTRRITPRVGSPVANEVDTEFRLRRDGSGWSIVAVAAR
jgi:eukaryotic-like serine/threonine-protein kinase